MRILFISGCLIGSGLCHKLVAEGNDVKLYIHEQHWERCLDGFIEKTTTWKDELIWVGKDGLIVFDDVCFGKEQNQLRKDGYSVVGGSELGDLLETDRQHFFEIAKKYGLNTLPSYTFNSADEAITFVKENPTRWVVKQNSHQSHLNFIGKHDDASDTLRVLQKYKDRNVSPIYLQKFASGIEVGIGRYFNGEEWVGPIEINHEHKALHNDDIGPLTPEMGTVIWYSDKEIKLFTETLKKLTPYLKEIDFRGDFDLNCIVTQNEIFPLEATPRFGNPSTELHVALHNSPWHEFLESIAKKRSYDLDYKEGFGVAVALVVPPFPYEPDNQLVEKQLMSPQQIYIDTESSEEDILEHIHFEEGMKVGDKYFWGGNHGAILYVTAHGNTISDARKIAYDRIKHIKTDNMYYRDDIGIRVESNDIPTLKKWGWV